MKYLKKFLESLRDENMEKIENVFLDFIDQGLCEIEIPTQGTSLSKLQKDADNPVVEVTFYDLYFKLKKQDVDVLELNRNGYTKKLNDLCKKVTGFLFTEIWDFSKDQTPEIDEAWEKWREFEIQTKHKIMEELEGTFKRLEYYGCKVLFIHWGDPSENPFRCSFTIATDISKINFEDLIFSPFEDYAFYFNFNSVNKTILRNTIKRDFGLNFVDQSTELDDNDNTILLLKFSENASQILQNNSFVTMLNNLKKTNVYKNLRYEILDVEANGVVKLSKKQ